MENDSTKASQDVTRTVADLTEAEWITVLIHRTSFSGHVVGVIDDLARKHVPHLLSIDMNSRPGQLLAEIHADQGGHTAEPPLIHHPPWLEEVRDVEGSVVYVIESPDRVEYVGQTTQLYERLKSHWYEWIKSESPIAELTRFFVSDSPRYDEAVLIEELQPARNRMRPNPRSMVQNR